MSDPSPSVQAKAAADGLLSSLLIWTAGEVHKRPGQVMRSARWLETPVIAFDGSPAFVLHSIALFDRLLARLSGDRADTYAPRDARSVPLSELKAEHASRGSLFVAVGQEAIAGIVVPVSLWKKMMAECQIVDRTQLRPILSPRLHDLARQRS